MTASARWLCVLGLAFASAAAGCRSTGIGNPFGAYGPTSPVVLSPTATAAEIVAAVNANASRVQTYQAPSASISMPESVGLPLVQASLAAERPLRFRMRATTALTGPEIDLGSNDERFWFWARRSEPPAIYTARHDQWAASPTRGQVPIEPAWLIDAMGLALLDPAAAYVGPVPRGDGSLELRTQLAGPTGPQQRVLLIDAQTALIKEQHVYDAGGSLAASAFADDFRYDPATGVSLPQRVRLTMPATALNLTIHTGPISVNAPVAAGGQLWSLPQIGSAPLVDLASGPSTAPLAANPWNLSGAEPTQARGDLTTRFADREPPVVAQPITEKAFPVASAATRGAQSVPATPVAAPVGPPAGFQSLPAGGREID